MRWLRYRVWIAGVGKDDSGDLPTLHQGGFFAETDLVNPGSGQVAVGYFEVRTPVCDGCQ